MHSDPRQGEVGNALRSAGSSGYEEAPPGRKGATQVAEVVDGVNPLSSASEGILPEERTAVLPFVKLPAKVTVRKQRSSPTMWLLILVVGDTLLIVALLLLSVPPLQPGLHISSEQYGAWNEKLVWGCLALISWCLALSLTRAQEPSHVANRLWGPLRIYCALALMSIFWMGLTYPFSHGRATIYAVFIPRFLLLAVPLFGVWRLSFAELLSLPRFRRRAVIVGINAAGKTMAREMYAARRSFVTILGYISEYEDDGNAPTLEGELPLLGNKDVLRSLARKGLIDTIIMTIDYRTNPELFAVALEAMQYGTSIMPMPVLYERASGKVPVEHVGDQWYVVLGAERTISLLYLVWSKAVDTIFGVCGSVILLCLLPILAALIYLDSPGAIFYTQERTGYQGKIFRILKFRSMHANAERSGSAIWAARDDDRVTRVGRVLRSTHLDELPQVINILRGDMSLVGPRPEREAFVIELEQSIPFYRCRLSIKPGLTGWAQVKYPYASTRHDALEKLQYDLYYIKHRSCTLDIFIMVKTVAEMFLCRGR